MKDCSCTECVDYYVCNPDCEDIKNRLYAIRDEGRDCFKSCNCTADGCRKDCKCAEIND